MKTRTTRIGLTGGIGSGKSEVARALSELGAYVIDADQLAREAVAPGSDALREIARLWPQVIDRAGKLDRAELARCIFSDEKARLQVNAIIHPIVRTRARELESNAAPGQIIIHMIPLLYEENLASAFDATILVVAPDEQRITRVGARDGLDEAAVRARMARQIDPSQARKSADYVIENDADLAQLLGRTTTVFEHLRRRSNAP